MALSANAFYEVRPRGITRTAARRIKDAAKIWFNAMVGLEAASGLLIPYDGAATTKYLGFATEERTGDTSLPAGHPSANCVVDESGQTKKVPVTGATGVTDAGAPVWGVDDGTWTLTDPAGGEIPVGYVSEYVSGTDCWVEFLSAQEWFAKN